MDVWCGRLMAASDQDIQAPPCGYHTNRLHQKLGLLQWVLHGDRMASVQHDDVPLIMCKPRTGLGGREF